MLQPANPTVVSKVRKLLAMAEGSTNPNEADAFSRKAAALIAEHRIDPDHLTEVANDELRVADYPIGRGAYVRGRLALLQVVAEAHGCSVVFEQRRDGTVAFVAGYRSDLDLVDLLYQSLHAQASSRMASERRATGAATQQWRRSFLFGYAQELRDMFAMVTTEATAPAAVASSLPVLRERDERVRDFVSDEFGPVRAARRPAPAQRGGFEAGQHAARRADLGRQRVGGQHQLGESA